MFYKAVFDVYWLFFILYEFDLAYWRLSKDYYMKSRFYYTTITEANEMNYFSYLFGKELCTYRSDLLPIIRSLNTEVTAIGICYTSDVVVKFWMSRFYNIRNFIWLFHTLLFSKCPIKYKYTNYN
jgi:hypothetical protein